MMTRYTLVFRVLFPGKEPGGIFCMSDDPALVLGTFDGWKEWTRRPGGIRPLAWLLHVCDGPEVVRSDGHNVYLLGIPGHDPDPAGPQPSGQSQSSGEGGREQKPFNPFIP